jgi:Na+-driven multidrug efflux pump
MPGPAGQRLFVSVLIGLLLVGVYWWAADAIPRAMLAEADAAAKIVVVGAR